MGEVSELRLSVTSTYITSHHIETQMITSKYAIRPPAWTTRDNLKGKYILVRNARLVGESQRFDRNPFARLLTTIVAMSGSKVDAQRATDQARCGLLHNLEL